jgi:hypothetical protein
MSNERKIVWTAVAYMSFACLMALPAQPASAQVVIPPGSIITNAQFTIHAFDGVYNPPVTVDLYRVTSPWAESGVTWGNFAGSFDHTSITDFEVQPGANVVNVTDLVQDWVDGTYQNHGILLASPDTFVRYYSSEDVTVANRPKLEISFTDPSGANGNVVIQRPDVAQDGVADAYIYEANPDGNFGYSSVLYTGMYYAIGEKQSLVRFFFAVEPPGPGTGTQGYWRNHPDAWPVDEIGICELDIGVYRYVYAKNVAIRKMKKPVRKDKTRSMFRQLVAAKLNVLIGNDDSCIAAEIAAADEWMCIHEVGSGVRARSPEWQDQGKPLHYMLNEYNNGRLGCANHRDD